MTTMLESIRKMIDSGKPFMPLAEHLGFRVKSVELGQAVIARFSKRSSPSSA
jgi:hypothetical protein